MLQENERKKLTITRRQLDGFIEYIWYKIIHYLPVGTVSRMRLCSYSMNKLIKEHQEYWFIQYQKEYGRKVRDKTQHKGNMYGSCLSRKNRLLISGWNSGLILDSGYYHLCRRQYHGVYVGEWSMKDFDASKNWMNMFYYREIRKGNHLTREKYNATINRELDRLKKQKKNLEAIKNEIEQKCELLNRRKSKLSEVYGDNKYVYGNKCKKKKKKNHHAFFNRYMNSYYEDRSSLNIKLKTYYCEV